MQDSKNHLELFGLPARYDLDRRFLHQRYLELTRETHPDFAAGAEEDDDAQLAALQRSAQVNEAYAVLSDDLRRAEYLLSLRGVSVAGVQPASVVMDRVFELRERLAAAENEGHVPRAEAARREASAWLNETMKQLGASLDSGRDDELLAEKVVTARYLRRIVGR